MERSKNNGTSERVHLTCAEGGCCPEAVFLDDGSVELSEFGQSVRLQPPSIERLVQELRLRGMLR